MKIHKVLLLLALTSFAAVCVGAYQYYSSLKHISIQKAREQAYSNVQALKNRLTIFITENLQLAHWIYKSGKLVTLSILVSSTTSREENQRRSILAGADKALYQAKSNRRNRVEFTPAA